MKNERRFYLKLLTGVFLFISTLLSAYNLPESNPIKTGTSSQETTITPINTTVFEISPTPTVTPTMDLFTPTISIITTTVTPTTVPTFTSAPNLTPISRLETAVSHALYHKWNLVYWSTNGTACDIYLIGETARPSQRDILSQCGPGIFWLWYTTGACFQVESSTCKGLYLYDSGQTDAIVTTKQIHPILVNAELSCKSIKQQEKTTCTGQPFLEINALDTKSGAWVKTIEVNGVSNQDTICTSDHCEVALPETGPEGIILQYWATSTLGDASIRHFLTIRASHDPTNLPYWQISMAGDQFKDSPFANATALSADWLSLPPPDPPDYLAIPDKPQKLTAQNDYYYLAGMLIREGLVSSNGCQGAGLEDNGITANECGMEKARPRLSDWQNIFDNTIFDTANNYHLPPRIIKAIFSRESQFFPSPSRTEIGLGHITDNGADTLLMYDDELYDHYCNQTLGTGPCLLGYTSLNNLYQGMLRGLVLKDADATCESCVNHIDNTRANASVDLFARLLLANGRQVGRIIEINLNKKPGEVASYVDLWKFTLLAYNAGAGCFEQTLLKYPQNQPLTWVDFIGKVSDGCRNGVYYAESITIP